MKSRGDFRVKFYRSNVGVSLRFITIARTVYQAFRRDILQVCIERKLRDRCKSRARSKRETEHRRFSRGGWASIHRRTMVRGLKSLRSAGLGLIRFWRSLLPRSISFPEGWPFSNWPNIAGYHSVPWQVVEREGKVSSKALFSSSMSQLDSEMI